VGASVSFGRALQTHDVRLSGGADGRYSTNGSWTFGGRFDAIGSGDRPSDVRHNNGTVFAEKRHLAQLTNFGRGNDSPLGSPAAFAMDQTTAGGAFEFVTPQGVRIAAGAAGVSTRTVSATAPNLTLDATHFVYGARVHVVHPGTSITHGNQIDVAATAAGWQEVHGRPYDFARVDVAWLDHYTPRTPIGTFAVMGHAALAFVSTGQAMPFFAQPTLGGTDLDGTSSLRSFSDYRFRAPNALTGSIEHELDLVGPIGSLLFADAGRVSDTRSGLGSGKFHHSFGAGIALRLGNTTVFRLFYAWGGGEGTRTTMTGSSDSFVTKLVGKGPF
jgi:hypothetical protein